MYVYAIHTTRANDSVGAVEIIYADEREAREYAVSRSTDHTVVSASVTRYIVGQLGARTPLALYLDGQAHPRPDRKTGRLYPTAD